jgi:Uma2 family endonuclease
MNQSQLFEKKLTAEEYLTYDDGTDTRYELVQGELVEMPPESNLNARIAMFLLGQFLQLVPFTRLCHKDAEIEVASVRASFRIPDLMVLSEAGEAALTNRPHNTITLEMPPPLLVIEVVSPDNSARDYRHKRSEYAVRGILEYWIVDPIQQKVAILTLLEGFYDETVFERDTPLLSPTFPSLILTPNQIFLKTTKP